MLATLYDAPFNKKGWIFETKWDGYRALAFKLGSGVKLISRNRLSFTERFPSIVQELKKLGHSFVVDGELVLLDEEGRSNFQLMQNYHKVKKGTPYYYVFDILSLDGKDLHELPLIERKAFLKKLLSSKKLKNIRYSSHVQEKGIARFKTAEKKGEEGIIAKRADSPYQFRRSKDWLKIKAVKRQEVVIGGFTAPKGSRKYFGALLVGVYEKGKFIYAGHVGGGFNQQLLSDTHAKLKKLVISECPFTDPPRPNAPVTWVEPKLICEVAFTEWTQGGQLRHPIFKGLRIDKSPKKVLRE